MATLPLKASHNEQHSVICFLWTKGLSTNAIHSEMRPMYGWQAFYENCNTRLVQEICCWAKICIWYWSAINCSWMAYTAASIVFASSIQKLVDRWDKYLNEFGWYVEKWNINVWCWNRCLLNFFLITHNAVLTLSELWRKSGMENTTLADCVLSTSDITIMMPFS